MSTPALVLTLVLSYLILTEPNFMQYLTIVFASLGVNVKRRLMMLWLYPRIKLDQFYIQRRLRKIRKNG